MRNGVSKDYEFKNAQGKLEWRCKYCQKDYILNGGTRNIVNHLQWYRLHENSPQEEKILNIQLNISNAISLATENSFKQH